jgi:hypothetical protein
MAAGAVIALFRANERKRYKFRDKSVVITGGSRRLSLEWHVSLQTVEVVIAETIRQFGPASRRCRTELTITVTNK